MRTGLGLRRRLINPLMDPLLGTITHVATERAVAALTFDDGPDPVFTPPLLDILEKHGARATFFMVGEAARRHPDHVRQVAERGHAVGNHTYDHPSLPLIPARERRRQIRACAAALAPYGQSLFRPPYGNLSVGARLDLAWLRYRVIGWNCSTQDWMDRDADWLVEQLRPQLRPGCIITLHDALYYAAEDRYRDRGPVLEAVDRLLGHFAGRFDFVTVPELLRLGRPQSGRWYGRARLEFLNSLQAAAGESRRYPNRPYQGLRSR